MHFLSPQTAVPELRRLNHANWLRYSRFPSWLLLVLFLCFVASVTVRGQDTEQTLRALLSDQNPNVRWAAANSLLRIDQSADPVLLVILQDSDAEVRHWAALILGKMGNSAGSKSLISDLDTDARAAAIIALGLIGDKAAGPRISQLLADPDLIVRAEAARALGRFGDKAMVPMLVQALLRETEPGVRVVICASLGVLGDPASVKTLRGFLDDPDELVRVQAAGAIYRLSRSKDAEKLLREAASGPNVHFRNFAAWHLAATGDSDAVALLEGQLVHPEELARYGAATALGEVRERSAVASLILSLSDSSPRVRAAAAAALGAIGDTSVKNQLREMLTDESGDVRSAAAAALLDLGDKDARWPLRSLLRSNPVVAGFLIQIGDDTVWEVFDRALQDGDPQYREVAARIAGEIRRSNAVRGLIPLLKDDSENVRELAIWALGLIGDPEAASALGQLLTTNDSVTNALAAQALGRIGKQSKDVLYKLLNERPQDDLVKVAVTSALARVESGVNKKEAVSSLHKLAKDQNPVVRMWAASGLMETGDASELTVLRDSLQSSITGLRVFTARALGDSGSRLAVPLLLAAARDPEPNVRVEVADGLGRLYSSGVQFRLKLRSAKSPDVLLRPFSLERLATWERKISARHFLAPFKLLTLNYLRV
jgi:HEAT repeat protein